MISAEHAAAAPTTRREPATHAAARALLAAVRDPAAGDWRLVLRVARSIARGDEDIAQEALLRLWRSRGVVRATSPGEAMSLLRTVVTRVTIDRKRARTHHAERVEMVEDALRPDGDAWHWPAVVASVGDHSMTHRRGVTSVVRMPAGYADDDIRHLDFLRARLLAGLRGRDALYAAAAWMRVVHAASSEVIAREAGAPSQVAAMKWVERGRPIVLEAVRADVDLDEDVRVTLVELFEARRADHGVPRPTRRRARAA